MPSIDALAPAASASDADELLISQAGVARKITRAQLLNGVQPGITIPAGSLLGNAGTTIGSPTAITLGQNLSLHGSTLAATAPPFGVSVLPAGNVPAAGDLIPIAQGGTTVAITYGQLLSGVGGASNVNLTLGLVTPAGSSGTITLGRLAANVLPLSGGTMTGVLGLSSAPVSPSHAANKAYVDLQVAAALPVAGGSMSGGLTLAGSPQNPLDAASKTYVDTVAAKALSASGGSLTGTLLLKGDPTLPLHASTKQYADLKVSRNGDTLAGSLILAGDPLIPLQAATKRYVDSQFALSLSKAGGTLAGSLFLASDPTSGAQAATKQYADRKISRSGDTLSGALMLSGDPTSPSQASTKRYVDSQFSRSVALSGASMSGALGLASDPALPMEASTKQYVDLHVRRTGDTLIGILCLAADPISPLQAASKQYVDARLASAVTPAGTTFTGAVFLANAPTTATQAATKQYVDGKVSRSGDTLSGALILAADPVFAAQAATKHYVDSQILPMLARSGGSLSGALILGSDPSAPAQASTKHYVDAQVATALALTGGSLSGMLSLAASPVVASHAVNKQYVDNQIATTLPRSGGTVSGMLTLAGIPTQPQHAATKAYVDANPNAAGIINIMLPPYNAKVDGVSDDTGAFKAAYQAAAAGATIYVPSGTTVLQQPGTWGIALTKRVRWMIAGTVLPDGTPLGSCVPAGGGPASFVLPGFVVGNTLTGTTTSQGASQTSDFAVNQSSYIVNHSGGPAGSVISNARADTIIYNSPANYVWGGLDRLVWAGTQAPSATTPTQHVGRYVQTLRQSATTGANGQPLPQPQLWAACLEYRDTTGQASSATNASLTVEMDWFGNGLDDANSRTIQSLVIGQHNTSGLPVQVSNIIGVYLSGGSVGSAKTVLSVGIPFSNAVIDTTNAWQINNAPVIRMAAGQAIAFEGTNSNRLAFDSSTNTLRWNQGSFSYVVGKGISVGAINSYSSSATLPNYISGNLIYLNGSSGFTITLPLASTVAAGTGYTFSVAGSGPVAIVTSGSDSIDSGSVTLRAHDRYHIVSNGVNLWQEVFWTNAVSPRYSGPVVLPSYSVASLPAGMPAGAKAFASNGRKPNEATGSGSGVEVCFDGQHWISSCSGAIVSN